MNWKKTLFFYFFQSNHDEFATSYSAQTTTNSLPPESSALLNVSSHFFLFLYLFRKILFFWKEKNHHANWNWHELKIFPRALGGHDTRLYMNRFFWDLPVVLIFCVEFQELSHLTRDLSQAEKKLTAVTSWATDKMTTIFTQFDNFYHMR